MTVRCNFHLHSRHSDGSLWPEQVVARAVGHGLTHLALTDHDTMDGVGEFLAACADRDLVGVAAAEIDCVAPELDFDQEILGYFPSGSWRLTGALCRERQRQRNDFAWRLLERAAEVSGQELDLIHVLDAKAGDRAPWGRRDGISITRVDVFRYLRGRGVLGRDIRYGDFKRGPISRAVRPLVKPHVREVVETIRADGGVAVLPHPGHLCRDDPGLVEARRDRIEGALATLRDWGLWGLELYCYRRHRDRLNEQFSDLARRLDLGLSWGSDCHGPGTRSDTMAEFWGEELPAWVSGSGPPPPLS